PKTRRVSRKKPATARTGDSARRTSEANHTGSAVNRLTRLPATATLTGTGVPDQATPAYDNPKYIPPTIPPAPPSSIKPLTGGSGRGPSRAAAGTRPYRVGLKIPEPPPTSAMSHNHGMSSLPASRTTPKQNADEPTSTQRLGKALLIAPLKGVSN